MAHKSITEETERDVVSLYVNHVKTQEIMQQTGIRSLATIYNILRKHGIEPQTYSSAHSRTIAVSIDETTDRIIKSVNPPNVSAWVCDTIKAAYPSIARKDKDKKD